MSHTALDVTTQRSTIATRIRAVRKRNAALRRPGGTMSVVGTVEVRARQEIIADMRKRDEMATQFPKRAEECWPAVPQRGRDALVAALMVTVKLGHERSESELLRIGGVQSPPSTLM